MQNKNRYLAAVAAEFPLFLTDIISKVHQQLLIRNYASCLLAKELDADMLIILTAVEKVAVNFGKEKRRMAG